MSPRRHRGETAPPGRSAIAKNTNIERFYNMNNTPHTTHPTFAEALVTVDNARNRMDTAWHDYEEAGHVTDTARTATAPRWENFGSSRAEKFAWELATIAEEIAWIEYSLARLEFEIARDGVADAKKKNRDKTI